MDEIQFLKHVYDRFNARDMETVLAAMHDDVVWANGMEGGHVRGRDGVEATGRASGPWSIRMSSQSRSLATPEGKSALKSISLCATSTGIFSWIRLLATYFGSKTG